MPGDLLVLFQYKEQFWSTETEERKGSERVLDPIVSKENAVKRAIAAAAAALCIFSQQPSQNP